LRKRFGERPFGPLEEREETIPMLLLLPLLVRPLADVLRVRVVVINPPQIGQVTPSFGAL